ncbi:hypothetical protein IQ235_14845 [Oscillatoriales cyanobacterium LEGE 11467]|uniref:Uncharacterized protein n=1 Tax=Zarconia navalis LEGE 11467 TaxID=1828826 RepID=A0A928ZAW3_9CYAN|nr:hypothetical protein [Zarconia navalis]MBE9042056.1 hypothetical protein [Zarconia navalis LEGE 11467]
MKLEFVPLLHIQRNLYNIPKGSERFSHYLETMLNADASDIELLPLAIMNPMGKERVSEILDTLLAMDADTIAARAISEVSDRFDDVPGTFKVGLVLADDFMGGWTNRYTTEFSARFEIQPSLKWSWLSGVLWTSEVPSVQTVRQETLAAVYRAVYIQRHGFARTLQEMLDREGYTMAMADCREPYLDAEDIAYTREIISPHLLSRDYPTAMVCLFGDGAARSLGYKPMGLSDRAGLALALHEARQNLANSK